MTETCPKCGNEYKRIGAHWQHYPEHRPSLTDEHHEIITGLMMSDGGVYESNTGSLRLKVSSITGPFLEHLSEKFGVLGGGIYLNESAKEMAARQAKRTDSKIALTADPDKYSDVFMFNTRSIPELKEYRDWYNSGCKKFPYDKIELTPRVLAYWFAGDGCYEKGNDRMRIAMNSQIGHLDEVEELFEDVGLPKPKWNIGNGNVAAYWSKDESKRLMKYMGDPIDGFNYKWN